MFPLVFFRPRSFTSIRSSRSATTHRHRSRLFFVVFCFFVRRWCSVSVGFSLSLSLSQSFSVSFCCACCHPRTHGNRGKVAYQTAPQLPLRLLGVLGGRAWGSFLDGPSRTAHAPPTSSRSPLKQSPEDTVLGVADSAVMRNLARSSHGSRGTAVCFFFSFCFCEVFGVLCLFFWAICF